MAELVSNLNPAAEEGVYDADSEEELMRSLLNEPGARFGQGEWVWTVVAQMQTQIQLSLGTRS